MQSRIPKITQEADIFPVKELDICSCLIVLLPAKGAKLEALPHGEEIQKRLKRAEHKLDSGHPFVTDLPNTAGTHIALAGIDSKSSAFELLTLARRLVAAHKAPNPERLAVACYGLDVTQAERASEAVIAAVLAAHFLMPTYKSEPQKLF